LLTCCHSVTPNTLNLKAHEVKHLNIVTLRILAGEHTVIGTWSIRWSYKINWPAECLRPLVNAATFSQTGTATMAANREQHDLISYNDKAYSVRGTKCPLAVSLSNCSKFGISPVMAALPKTHYTGCAIESSKFCSCLLQICWIFWRGFWRSVLEGNSSLSNLHLRIYSPVMGSSVTCGRTSSGQVGVQQGVTNQTKSHFPRAFFKIIS
jgi:hypothetical protein